MLRRSAAVTIAALLAIGVSACSSGQTSGGASSAGAGGASASPSASQTPTPTPVALAIAPARDAKGVRPDAPVTVRAAQGSLMKVVMTAADGTVVPGEMKDGVWTSSARKVPSMTYTLAVDSTRSDGSPQHDSSTFKTLVPAVTATYHLLYDNVTLGVGAPATIQFDSRVATKEMRAAIERNVSITTTPKTEGSWGWLDNRQLMWRPKDFWKPGTKVSVKTNFAGLQTGDSKWVARNASGSFTIGDAMISTVDIPNHTLTVRRNGEVLHVFPVSSGSGAKPEYVTRSGTKVIIERNGDMTMDSETVGVKKGEPGYYKVETKSNLRVTWTGEFLHSAPWSTDVQGSANVSHGCVNMAPANAKWMFENSKVGDVIKFTGSDRPFLPTDGIGVWVYSYDQWKKQSALTA